MPLSESALELAAGGWPVFPVRLTDKRPKTTHGHLDATTDPEIIRGWASRFDHGGGIATPTGHGLLVIDVDPRSGGVVPPWGWIASRRAGMFSSRRRPATNGPLWPPGQHCLRRTYVSDSWPTAARVGEPTGSTRSSGTEGSSTTKWSPGPHTSLVRALMTTT